MPNNYWSDNDSAEELDPLSSLISEITAIGDAEEEEFSSDFFQGSEGRRRKAAFLLMVVWAITLGLHFVSWGIWLVWSLAAMILFQAVRLVSQRPETNATESLTPLPRVSLLVAAKNEEAVIARLVKQMCELNYPQELYEVWIIDDHSTDRTPQILEELQQQYPHLKILQRLPGASGGKSGALNAALPLTQGEIIGVFDADAGISADLLERVVPLFSADEIGAVQVRKAIANAEENFWTRGQSVEMALDSYFQQQRIAAGGTGELRGNGQFVRRQALEGCGGWNEQTITDDLDLTIRLHLDNWKIELLLLPPVAEEGVTTPLALWHQRNRWGEGGYQRYLDYWRFLLPAPMGWRKKIDLSFFLFIQYLLPTAAVSDLLMVILRHRPPQLSLLSGLVLSLSSWGMVVGLRRARQQEKIGFRDWLDILGATGQGLLYMIHWFIVIPSITARMAVRPKRLKWVKTVHAGSKEESLAA
jgi:1,2-diacylglycerol 3-beta-glucosyltransferase